jgi:hypothetical protein
MRNNKSIRYRKNCFDLRVFPYKGCSVVYMRHAFGASGNQLKYLAYQPVEELYLLV